jgi:hypothetical protein
MTKAINRKPAPLNDYAAKGSQCPVCGKITYSAGRIHPQCAMVQADRPRKLRLAAEKRALKAKSGSEE